MCCTFCDENFPRTNDRDDINDFIDDVEILHISPNDQVQLAFNAGSKVPGDDVHRVLAVGVNVDVLVQIQACSDTFEYSSEFSTVVRLFTSYWAF